MRVAICLLLAAPLAAQDWYRPHNIHIGVGAGTPRGDLGGSFRPSALLSAGYGYRFQRYLQLDLGLDAVFGAAGVRDFLPSAFGDLRIRDYQIMAPVGGRAILPLAGDRVLLWVGGGGTHLSYGESLEQPSEYFEITCRRCRDRGGWGYYSMFGGSVAVTKKQPNVPLVRVGVNARYYRGFTDGDAFGAVPGVRTQDRWLNIFAEVTISFAVPP